jgi:hypothetical protein
VWSRPAASRRLLVSTWRLHARRWPQNVIDNPMAIARIPADMDCSREWTLRAEARS